jgi:hypothetical protein
VKSSNFSPYLRWSKHEEIHPHRLLIIHISVRFPAENHKEEPKYTKPWGIAWAVRHEAEEKAYGFISTVLHSKVPKEPVNFFEHFLEHLRQYWNELCSGLDADFEKIVSPFPLLQIPHLNSS